MLVSTCDSSAVQGNQEARTLLTCNCVDAMAGRREAATADKPFSKALKDRTKDVHATSDRLVKVSGHKEPCCGLHLFAGAFGFVTCSQVETSEAVASCILTTHIQLQKTLSPS